MIDDLKPTVIFIAVVWALLILMVSYAEVFKEKEKSVVWIKTPPRSDCLLVSDVKKTPPWGWECD